MRRAAAGLAACSVLAVAAFEISLDWQAALNRINADSLRGHLSFLASDLLEGRNTPSRGLDLAAEYIAAQFRRAGLEPAGDDAYFQTAAAGEPPAPLRNVIAVLRGSDPVLRDSYVMLGAHYDHLGEAPSGDGDRIYNGANDNASGAVAVIEVASVLAALPVRPRRSIVFLAFFGEEKRILGARYYTRNPVFPIDKTVAVLILEQIGRTDSSEGPQLASANLTGFDYSSLPPFFVQAGQYNGVRVWKHERNSDGYFRASDNIAFAEAGVPAHTLSVTYSFPDYHRPGDHWDKIDYANMEKVVRTVALGLLMLADSLEPPRWNEANPRTERFRKARP